MDEFKKPFYSKYVTFKNALKFLPYNGFNQFSKVTYSSILLIRSNQLIYDVLCKNFLYQTSYS